MKVKAAFSRKVAEPRQLLTQEEIDGCKSVSDAIRKCLKKFPDAKDREISDFLELGRPQWVWNVRHQNLKKK